MAKLFPDVALVKEFWFGRKWRLFSVLLLHLRYYFSSLHSRYSLISLNRGRFILFSVRVLPDPCYLLGSACSRTVNRSDCTGMTWLRRSSTVPGTRSVCQTYTESTLGWDSNWLPLSPCFFLEAIQVNILGMSLNTLWQIPDLDGLRAKRECQGWKACQAITSSDLGKTLGDLLPTKF